MLPVLPVEALWGFFCSHHSASRLLGCASLKCCLFTSDKSMDAGQVSGSHSAGSPPVLIQTSISFHRQVWTSVTTVDWLSDVVVFFPRHMISQFRSSAVCSPSAKLWIDVRVCFLCCTEQKSFPTSLCIIHNNWQDQYWTLTQYIRRSCFNKTLKMKPNILDLIH